MGVDPDEDIIESAEQLEEALDLPVHEIEDEDVIRTPEQIQRELGIPVFTLERDGIDLLRQLLELKKQNTRSWERINELKEQIGDE